MKHQNRCLTILMVLYMAGIIAQVDIGSAFAIEKVPAIIDGKPASQAADLYASEPERLKPVECGQCHSSLYGDLKSAGGRHKFECQKCHKNFHAYNPVKNNWQELMPKCRECHLFPHGEKISDCSACHSNPHAATKIPMSKTLVNSCTVCHGGPFEQLQNTPSAHSKLLCDNCHTSHGYIPGCNACHKAHFEGQDFKNCASECHPVHQPRNVSYKKDTDARTCAACHDKVYATLSKSQSKHSGINCANCHSKHRYNPQCSVCHAGPHSKQLHEKFPKCLTCHQSPHDLPVKQRR